MSLTKLGLVGLVALSLTGAPSLASAQDAPAPAPEAAPPPPPPPPPPAYQAAPAPTFKPGSIRDSSEFTRPLALSVMAYVPWWYGFGIGGKVGFEIPIVPNGFISSLNDQISIEPSLSIATVDYGYGNLLVDDDFGNLTEILPAVAGMWSFHLSDEFRVYGSVLLGYGIFTGDVYNDDDINYFYFEVAVGVFYKLTDSIALRGEVGWRALRGGVAILF